MGSTGVIKLQILCFCLLAPLLLLLQLLNALGGYRKLYTGSLKSWSFFLRLPLMDQPGVIKLKILCFWPLSTLLLFIQLLNVLGGDHVQQV